MPHTGVTVHVANTAAATAVVVSWTNWLPPALSVIATGLTIIYMGIQITIISKNYLDKRELARGPRGKTGATGPAGVDGLDGVV